MKRLFLNGKPYFHNGLLDQGWWPDGLYTAPSDEALRFDIETAKAMGFNMLRKHVKVEPLRWYYHCDRLGMLVWQDMPNGGGAYNARRHLRPAAHRLAHERQQVRRLRPAGRARARPSSLRELREMVTELYNCPCIAMWVPFNEGWGQFDAERCAAGHPGDRRHADHRPRQRLARPGHRRYKEPARLFRRLPLLPGQEGPLCRALRVRRLRLGCGGPRL